MKNKKGWVFLIFGIIIFLLVGSIFAYWILYALTSGDETITINEKWVKYHNHDAKYLVSSTDGQVFQITDSLTYMRFDSSNLYAYLKPGMTCELKTQGWRFPLFSDYKNIINVVCNENKIQ